MAAAREALGLTKPWVVARDLVENVGAQDLALLGPFVERELVQIAPAVGQRQMQQTIASPHASGYQPAQSAHGPALERPMAPVAVLGAVAVVAGEQFVTSIPRQDYLHVTRGELRDH